MLPVYLGMYRYRGQLFPFAVNGQTGGAYAKAPHSPLRVALVVASGVLLAAVLIVVLIRLWPYLSPIFGSLSIDINDINIENKDVSEIIKEMYDVLSRLIKLYRGK